MPKMKTRSNRQLLLGHSILHRWAKDPGTTNWTKTQIRNEHRRLVKLMKKRGIEHHTPLKFSKRWK